MKTDEQDLVAVIMAGGVGTRFWPLSTEEKPKQFLNFFDDHSLLQKSFERVADLIPHQRILVLTNATFVNLVREQLPQLPPENIIGEPLRRDTAAAVCLAAVLGRKRFGNPVIVTLTSDHLIEPVELFQKTLLSAARQARAGEVLYTLAIQPTHPATGYGYLKLGRKVADDEGIEHFELAAFKEKPDLQTARQYIEAGNFYWNSGMFIWTAEAILNQIATHLPNHLQSISKVADFDRTPRWQQVLKEAFEPLETISIDYAVMEKAKGICCAVAKFAWIDVGGWEALRDFLPKDQAGNSCRGKAFTLDAVGNLVFCDDPSETVMLIGVENLIIVRANQKTLIAHKDRSEDIKKIIPDLEE